MSLLTLAYPEVINAHRDCRNGMRPTTAFMYAAVSAENHITAFRKKCILQWNAYLGDSRIGAGGGTIDHTRVRCHVGYGTTRLVARAILGIAATSGAAPHVHIEATIVGGATSSFSPDMHSGATALPPTDAPSEWSHFESTVEVTPNTTYELLVQQIDHVRILSLTIYEESDGFVDESTDYYNEHTPQAFGKIFDSHRQRLLPGLSKMWQRNGGLQINFGREEGAAQVRTSATPINLIDDTTTGTPTANTPGWVLDLAYRTTVSRAVVPVVFAVYGWMSTGLVSGTVQLTDTAGVSPLSVTVNSATPQWWVTTGYLTAATAKKYDPQYFSDGTNALSVTHVSLYEYEA